MAMQPHRGRHHHLRASSAGQLNSISRSRLEILHGLGLFADEFIPKGIAIWRFDGRVDSHYDDRLDLRHRLLRISDAGRGAGKAARYRPRLLSSEPIVGGTLCLRSAHADESSESVSP